MSGGRRFILLEADGEMSPWSKLCVSQADCVLLVAAPDASPQVHFWRTQSAQ